jgi:leader peptidase (prepilin peptidase)/N-methyltransferase
MPDLLTFLSEELPWFLPTACFVLGALVGSFLNVCIYRIPAGRSIVFPGSRCGCGQGIAWYDNLPILSWLILRGRARCCGRPFSFRYPFVEALTGALFCGAWIAYGATSPLVALVVMGFCAIMVVATFIDIDHMIIPDRFSIGGTILGVLCSILVPALHAADPAAPLDGRFQSLLTALIGVLVGSGVTLWILILAETILRKEAMGFGDVKLMGAIGAVCGWQGALFAIFGGSVLGTIFVLFVALWQKTPWARVPAPPAGQPADAAAENGPIAFGRQMPFGPMLAGGAVLYLLVLKGWFDDYLGQIAPLFQP